MKCIKFLLAFLLVAVLATTGWSQCPPTGNDAEAPTVTCAEFAMTYDDCPDGLGSNTPNGMWTPIGPTGGINNAVGGSYSLFLDLTTCVTDNCTDIEDMEYTLLASYSENVIPGCSIDLINEWQIRDASGNISPDVVTFRGTIAFTGTTPPVIVCPANIGVECGESLDPMDTGMATATSDCGDPDITFVDVLAPACGTTGIITRTWTATTGCGETSSCVQIITTFDTQLPVLPAAPSPATVECDAVPMPEVLMATDACAGMVMGVAADVTTPGACDNSYTITRTWTFTDACGNSDELSQEITVEDTTPPDVTCVEFTATFDRCPYPLGPNTPSGNWIAVPTNGTFQTAVGGSSIGTIDLNNCVTDNCSDFASGGFEYMASDSYEENRVPGCSVDIINEFMIRDICGNVSPTTFIFRGMIQFGGPAPVIVCPANATVECGAPTDPAATEEATATPDCGDPAIAFTDTSVPGCGLTEVISRTWTATDGCGTVSAYTQTITIVDTTPPVIVCPANATVECGDPTDPTATGGDATATDICGGATVAFADSSVPGCGLTEVISRTWTATDDCGNLSVCTQTITVEDSNPPVITCPVNLTVECDQPTDPGATGNATASNDNCAPDAELTLVFSDVSNQTPTGCGNDSYTITRTWTASDPCGNATNCVQVITVEDTTPPTIICPANLTIECTEDTSPANTGTAIAVDNCTPAEEIIITFADVSVPSCGNTEVITRTWTATDACGNATNCVQIVTVEDTTPPVIITGGAGAQPNPPANANYTLDNTVASNYIPINVAANFIGNGDDVSFAVALGGSFSLYGNVVNALQVSSNGYVSVDPTDSGGDLSNDCPIPANPSTGPDAARLYVLHDDIDLDPATPGSGIYYQFFATSPYTHPNGSIMSASIIEWVGEHFPAGSAPTDLQFQAILFENGDVIYQYLQDAEDGLGSTIGAQQSAAGPALLIACNTAGTSVSAGAYGLSPYGGPLSNTPLPDIPAAVVECDGAGNLIDLNDCLTSNGGLAATDACGDVTWTNDFDGLSDNCGNTSYIAYSFYVTALDTPEPPQTSSIAGMIHTEEMEAVEDVEVYLSDGASFFEMYVTGNDGMYAFSDVPLEQNYSVSPYSNQFPMNGVSSFDLILIAQHILSINQLDSPYKMIAADVNRSGSVTTLDLVELRKMILMIDTEFANNNSWRFVDANFVFPYVENPFATAFPEIVNINGLFESVQHDFVGVKIGDVNGTVIPNTLTGGDDRSFNGDLPFNVQDVEMETGETYEVAFSSSEFEAIMGYQYTLNFDTDLLEFVEVQGGDLEGMSESNFGLSLLAEGAITTSWTNDRPLRLSEDEVLYYVNFTAKRATLLSEALSISSRYTKAEAYDVSTENGQLNLLNVTLRFDGALSTKFSLMQNTPNPFNDETVIGFILPEASFATMTVYDVSGRALKSIDGNYEAGYNEVSLDRGDLKSGMMYYTLTTSDRTLTKKMLLIDQK